LPYGYAEVTIEAVTPGAELGGVIYDQWVTVSGEGVRLELFDMDCICPEFLVGTTRRVKIGLMATKIVPSGGKATTGKGNTFVARIIQRNRGDKADLIEVNGIPMHLLTDRGQNPGAFLEIRGRLDLLDIESEESEGWRSPSSNR